jgi:hypothetical protein
MSASACAISTRSPFFLFLNVGGNKLMRLKSSAPAVASKVTANVLLELGASFSGTISNSCSVHALSTAFDFTSTEANTSSVRLACNETVKEPLYVPFTQKDPVYFC